MERKLQPVTFGTQKKRTVTEVRLMLFLMSSFEKKLNQEKKKRAQQRMVQQLKDAKRRKEIEKKGA